MNSDFVLGAPLGALAWIVAAQCAGGSCVTVALTHGGDVAVGDTKNPDRAPHVFTPDEWDAFIDAAKEGRFDRAALPLPLAVPA